LSRQEAELKVKHRNINRSIREGENKRKKEKEELERLKELFAGVTVGVAHTQRAPRVAFKLLCTAL